MDHLISDKKWPVQKPDPGWFGLGSICEQKEKDTNA